MGISPGSIAFSAPAAPDDYARRLIDLERAVREMAAARSLGASAIGSGGLLVKDGGSITIQSPGTLNVGGGVLNSAGSIAAGTSISAGTTISAGSTISTPANVQGGGLVSTGAASIATNLGVGGTVSANQVNASAGISSPGAYTTDVSTLPGARQNMWQHNSGVIGYAPSTIVSKTNLGPVPFTASDVLAVQPYMFQYKSQIAIRDDPENEFYDSAYVPSWDIGLMAEHLIAHNMACFVFYEDDGTTPKGILYELFGAIAPLVVFAEQEARIAAIEAALHLN